MQGQHARVALMLLGLLICRSRGNRLVVPVFGQGWETRSGMTNFNL